MAGIVRITEYAELATDANGHTIQAGMEPAITVQSIASGAASAASATFNAATKFVRIDVTTRCFMRVGGGTPTAVTTDTPLEANAPEMFGIRDAGNLKLAVIE